MPAHWRPWCSPRWTRLLALRLPLRRVQGQHSQSSKRNRTVKASESRGAHSRFDFPERDDDNWLCHSVYLPESETMLKREVNMAPVLREAFPPKARTY